jgi:hypothetical protein
LLDHVKEILNMPIKPSSHISSLSASVIFAQILVVLFLLIAPFAKAWAEEAPPPRPFPADRPGKASGPITVDQGHLEFESDIINYLHAHPASSSVTTNGYTIADPLIKVGISHDVDVELQMGGYQWYSFKDRSTGVTTHASGFADEVVRTKINLMGNDGSDFAIGIIPYIKLPLASSSLRNSGLSNTSVEGGVIVPTTYNLSNDFVLGFQTEIDANRNADDGNFHTTFVNIPSISHPIPGIDNLVGMLELYSGVTTSKSVDDPNIYTLDLSLAYQLTPQTAFDVETDIGLNRDAPNLQLISGLAWLF